MCYFSFVYCKFKKIDILSLPSKVAKPLFWRCFTGYTCMITSYMSIFLLPFSLAIVLIFTQPISTVVLCAVFGNEHLSLFEYFAIAFAMLGVVILMSPATVFFWIDPNTLKVHSQADYPYFYEGIAIAIIASITGGLISLFSR